MYGKSTEVGHENVTALQRDILRLLMPVSPLSGQEINRRLDGWSLSGCAAYPLLADLRGTELTVRPSRDERTNERVITDAEPAFLETL